MWMLLSVDLAFPVSSTISGNCKSPSLRARRIWRWTGLVTAVTPTGLW